MLNKYIVLICILLNISRLLFNHLNPADTFSEVGATRTFAFTSDMIICVKYVTKFLVWQLRFFTSFTFSICAQFPFPIVHSLIFPHFPSVVNFEGSSSVPISDLEQSSLSMCNVQFTNSLYNFRGITFIFYLYLGNYLHEAYLQSRNVIVFPI